MFCTYCNAARVENEAPCPNCGAPSPFLGRRSSGSLGAGNPGQSQPWSQTGPQVAFDNQMPSWQQPGSVPEWPQSGQQQKFGPSWPQQSGPLQNSVPAWPQSGSSPSWQQGSSPNNTQSSWQGGSSLNNSAPSWQQEMPPMPSWQQSSSADHLMQPVNGQQDFSPVSDNQLVPFQQPGMEDGRRPTLSLQLVPEHTIAHLVQPAPEFNTTYVPPMYTKPRPIIPRYRVISGLLSVLIVALLACGGVGYFAQTRGAFAFVGKLSGTVPQSVPQRAAPTLPDPPAQGDKDKGEAYNIIPVATTTTRVGDANLAIEQQNIFKPNMTFYVTYSVLPTDTDGEVSFKWYTNGQPFLTTPDPNKPQDKLIVKAKEGNKSGRVEMRYAQPAEGSVEILWNGKLAQRLYFVVR